MRAKKGTIDIDGDKVQANLLSFAFKPYGLLEQPRLFKQILSRAETFWSDKETPDVFVIGDKFENGNEVRKGWPSGHASCYDWEWPGEFIGFLKKSGRSWTVVANERDCHGI